MNKFYVFPCARCSRDGYDGQAIQMACTTNINNVLMFPVDAENAKLIDGILNSTPESLKTAEGTVKAYRTMLNSWVSGGRFLSGIFMSVEFCQKDMEDVISTCLIISDEYGAVDSIVRVDFTTAVIIAVLDRKEIILSVELMKKLVPKFNESEKEQEKEQENTETTLTKEKPPAKVKKETEFPIDNDIMEIAKKIMSGKIK